MDAIFLAALFFHIIFVVVVPGFIITLQTPTIFHVVVTSFM